MWGQPPVVMPFTNQLKFLILQIISPHQHGFLKHRSVETNLFEFVVKIQGCPYSTDPSGNSITFDRDARSLNDILRLKRQSKNGTVNKQNCRIYATENPQEIQEVPHHYVQRREICS